MPLAPIESWSPDAARGGETRARLGWRDVVLYALGVGAASGSATGVPGEPPDELDHVYEGRGPAVLPTFYTALAFRMARPLLRRAGGDPARAVFGEATVRASGEPQPPATLRVRRSVTTHAIGALGVAELAFHFAERAPGASEVATVTLQVYFPDQGRPGAPLPPRRPRVPLPGRAPDWRVALATRPDQALLYRLSGDTNPLHVDPEFAARMGEITGGRPILHGLCTLGFVGRGVSFGTGRPLTALSGRFARPVWPGETLVVSGWEGQPGIRVTTEERPAEEVLTAVRAEVG